MNALVSRHRGFRLLWIGETTSGLGTSISTVVIPLVAVTILHSSAFVVSCIAAATWLPWLLFGLVVGPYIDRAKRRELMILCDVVAACLFVSIPIAYALGVLHAGQLLVVAFGAGCVNVVFNTSYGKFVVDLIDDPADRAKANSMLQGSASAVRVSGIGVGGLLVQLIGATSAIVADAVSFVISAICLVKIRLEPRVNTTPVSHEPFRRQVIEGIDFTFRDRFMRPLVLYAGCSNFALVGYQSLLVVFLVRTVGLSAGAVGMVMALMSCGGVIGAFVGNPLARRLGDGRALFLTKVLACPCALLIPLTGTSYRVAFAILGGLGVGVGIVAGNVISSGFFQTYTPHELFARTGATQNVFSFGAIPLGALSAGAIAATWGVPTAMWVMTALLPLTALFLVVSPYRSLRTLPTSAAQWPRGLVDESFDDEATISR
jgi:MFS family permease